jgi:sugar lactone lactonase YvrE
MNIVIDYTKGFVEGSPLAEKVGTITGTTLDLTSGNVFSYTPTADTTFVFSNPPTSGTALGFTLVLTGLFIDDGYDLANAEPPVYGFFDAKAQETSSMDIFFKPDGTKMYVIGSVGRDVNEYDLSTAWDVSTASYLQRFSISAQETSPTGIFFKPDGTKMYVLGNTGDDVNEYDLSTAWDITSASYLQNFSVSAQDTSPQGIFFKPDGTKMYIIGSSGDDVNEYDLSTAWDVTSASYLQNFSVAAQETGPSGIFFRSDGLKMYVIGFVGDDVNEYDLSTAWDITSASYLQNFSVFDQESGPQGIFFRSDGLKMYVIGSHDAVFSYTLSTAWDLSSASFDFPTKGYFSVAAQETVPQGIFFKPDGTKMYIIGSSGDDVNEYDLSTAWEVSTASYLYNFSVSAQETSPSDIFFKPDGTKMYVIGRTGDDVNEYNLSTAWNVSTASYLQNFSVSAQETEPRGLSFKPDGTKMYVTGTVGRDINEYNLSTAWDVSTASYLQNFSLAARESQPMGVFFKPNGTKMYILGAIGDDVNEYNLSTPWNVSTASYLQNFSVAAQDEVPQGIFLKPDGTKMYVVGEVTDAVWQYSTGTGHVTFTWPASVKWAGGSTPDAPAGAATNVYTFYTEDGGTTYYGFLAGAAMARASAGGDVWTNPDLANASYDSVSFSVAAQETDPSGIFFKPDGTKMYVIGFSGDDVNEYNLSTAWDITSASYLQNFSVAAQETDPSGLFFRSDGLKMYVIGFSGDDVNEYNLSTAWDITSASYLQNFSVAAQETLPSGLFFRSDGLKMYVIGYSGDKVNEYDLSTAWDVSTASYSLNFSVAAQETNPFGLFFKPNGSKMYIIGSAGNDVNEYDLSTAWDVSSASYLQNFSVASQETSPQDVFFKPDGTKMYIIGISTDTIYQYSTT